MYVCMYIYVIMKIFFIKVKKILQTPYSTHKLNNSCVS